MERESKKQIVIILPDLIAALGWAFVIAASIFLVYINLT